MAVDANFIAWMVDLRNACLCWTTSVVLSHQLIVGHSLNPFNFTILLVPKILFSQCRHVNFGQWFAIFKSSFHWPSYTPWVLWV